MKYLKEQIRLHPSMQAQDVAKFCFQSVFGAEHLLMNVDAAKSFLLREFEQIPAHDEPLIENISDEYCRVNLAAWKLHGFSIDNLFSMFLQTAQTKSNATTDDLEKKLHAVTVLSKKGALPFPCAVWTDFLRTYERKPLHHSDIYRRTENPAYRVVLRHLLNVSALYR